MQELNSEQVVKALKEHGDFEMGMRGFNAGLLTCYEVFNYIGVYLMKNPERSAETFDKVQELWTENLIWDLQDLKDVLES